MLMQPMLARLHELYPDARIDAFAPPWTAPLLKLFTEIHEVIENPFPHGTLQLAARRHIGRTLQDKAYDHAIVLPNSFKSALVPFFAGIPLRTGFIGECRYGLLNDARKLNKRTLPLMVQRYAQLAEAPGVAVPHPLPSPELHIPESRRLEALKKFQLHTDKPVAALCPGAEYGPAKRWPIAYFAELAQNLHAQGYQVWLFGSAKDKDVADRIVALGNPESDNLCGITRLDEAVALLSCADMVVSNDSGLMHLAAALKRPLLALYGSSSPGFTPPLSETAQVLKLDLTCSPCFKRECPLGHFNCMNQLTPEIVIRHLPHTRISQENHVAPPA